ncbi:hypothetical protein GCM10022243_12190 [Saccharothrix violaceirubra]|uniref:Uncharacterized protein n=1 Tax=Saccharothrix violaceirubra TaxID=413306 RepID=A0A7W7WZE4_9PSEU|nr:hypothetical protein [Saccharothrix violaceirubra]MBB4968718.1 hypothetical protein [Saccharothrix violaceirubra]
MTDTPGRIALRILLRVVLAAAVGAALLLLWVSVFTEGTLDRALEGTSMGEFLLIVVVGLPLALVSSVLLAGPVLWLLRVRPVWPIVLLGPLLFGLAQWFGVHDKLSWLGDRWTVLAVLAALAYAVAALITSPAALKR